MSEEHVDLLKALAELKRTANAMMMAIADGRRGMMERAQTGLNDAINAVDYCFNEIDRKEPPV